MDDSNWYWACENREPSGDKFIIEQGQDAMWRRIRSEISRDEICSWMLINRRNEEATVGDMLDMMLTTVPSYGVNHNRFVMEAAKIPVFASFLRNARADLCNYVSNSAHRSVPMMQPEPFSGDKMRALGAQVNATLGIEDDWF